jgi:inorganic pyrophosphatase
MEMTDGGERDDKIVAVPVDDPRFENMRDLADINPHFIKEMSHFFETYKKVQKKEVSVGQWHTAAEAHAAFERSRTMYEENKVK